MWREAAEESVWKCSDLCTHLLPESLALPHLEQPRRQADTPPQGTVELWVDFSLGISSFLILAATKFIIWKTIARMWPLRPSPKLLLLTKLWSYDSSYANFWLLYVRSKIICSLHIPNTIYFLIPHWPPYFGVPLYLSWFCFVLSLFLSLSLAF